MTLQRCLSIVSTLWEPLLSLLCSSAESHNQITSLMWPSLLECSNSASDPPATVCLQQPVCLHSLPATTCLQLPACNNLPATACLQQPACTACLQQPSYNSLPAQSACNSLSATACLHSLPATALLVITCLQQPPPATMPTTLACVITAVIFSLRNLTIEVKNS